MNSEHMRINSFFNWRHYVNIAILWPTQLARNGFFYQSNTDTIECFRCHLTISVEALRLGQDIRSLHRERMPRCTFANNSGNTSNIPLGNRFMQNGHDLTHVLPSNAVAVYGNQTLQTVSTQSSRPFISGSNRQRASPAPPLRRNEQRSTNGQEMDERRRNHIPQKQRGTAQHAESLPPAPRQQSQGSNKQNQTLHQLRENNSVTIPPARFPDFIGSYTRETTFRQWPRERHPITDGLVRALTRSGFFYTGDDDYVKCHHCGHILSVGRHYKDGVDPLQVHLQRNKYCHFAKQLLDQRDQGTSSGGSSLESGTDIGLESITTTRPRGASGSEGHIADSIGHEVFSRRGSHISERHNTPDRERGNGTVRSRHAENCKICEKVIGCRQPEVQCYYCKRSHHRDCLKTAVRMRDVYHANRPEECFNLHATVPVQATPMQSNAPSCMVVGGDSNVNMVRVRYIQEHDQLVIGTQDPTPVTNRNQSNGRRWTCNDCVQTRNREYCNTMLLQNLRTRRPWNPSTENFGHLLIGGNSNANLVQYSMGTHSVAGTTTHAFTNEWTCPDCIEAMNRLCGRCCLLLRDGNGILRVQCRKCKAWFHKRCLTRKKKGAIFHDADWECSLCDPENVNSSSSSEDYDSP